MDGPIHDGSGYNQSIQPEYPDSLSKNPAPNTIGPVETLESQPYPIYSVQLAGDVESLEVLGVYKSIELDRQLTRFSTEGYIYDIWGYDANHNFTLLESEYVHKGEVSTYYKPLGLRNNFYLALFWIEESEPPVFHKVR